MITFQITTEVKDDRRVVLTLPPEVPTGRAELVITVEALASANKQPLTSLVDWAELQVVAEGKGLARYPLRGSVVSYDRPTEPAADADWEALR